jgi:hypothetical protein
MACPITTQKGNPCGARIKQYGVCGRHFQQAYDGGNDPICIAFIQEMSAIMRAWQLVHQRCETLGKNVQGPYNGNLCSNPDPNTIEDADLRESTALLQRSNDCILRYQQLADPYLISNIAAGLTSTILNPNSQEGLPRSLWTGYVLRHL